MPASGCVKEIFDLPRSAFTAFSTRSARPTGWRPRSKPTGRDCEATLLIEQAWHYPDDRRPLFARAIAMKYGIDITPDGALTRLQRRDAKLPLNTSRDRSWQS